MIVPKEYPILEFDTARNAVIEPSIKKLTLPADKLVITFFPDVIERMLAEGTIRKAFEIPGENVVVLYSFTGRPDILLTLGYIGCPACAGNLDMLHAMGIEKTMFCGGGGVLDKSIAVGELLVVEGAIRDEGFSYHYLEPSRIVYADSRVTETITEYLSARGIPHLSGLTWTTDAIFRETEERIALRRTEGARIVEMEQAGCLAVAQYRGFSYGAIIYGGDDVSQPEWDNRDWRSRNGIRYDLVMLCRELVQHI